MVAQIVLTPLSIAFGVGHAWSNHASGAFRVNVICHPATGAIAGYVTLNAARAFLPKAQQRNQPNPVPVTFSASSRSRGRSRRRVPH